MSALERLIGQDFDTQERTGRYEKLVRRQNKRRQAIEKAIREEKSAIEQAKLKALLKALDEAEERLGLPAGRQGVKPWESPPLVNYAGARPVQGPFFIKSGGRWIRNTANAAARNLPAGRQGRPVSP